MTSEAMKSVDPMFEALEAMYLDLIGRINEAKKQAKATGSTNDKRAATALKIKLQKIATALARLEHEGKLEKPIADELDDLKKATAGIKQTSEKIQNLDEGLATFADGIKVLAKMIAIMTLA